MNGIRLDLILLTGWAVVFLAVSLLIPGLANLIVGWVGGVALLWYDDVVRHTPDGSLKPRWVR